MRSSVGLFQKFRQTLEYVVSFMLFNVTFNNISAISWRSVLLVEEIGGRGENHQPVASYRQTLSHNVVQVIVMFYSVSVADGDCYVL
jgi:hypothetical protein